MDHRLFQVDVLAGIHGIDGRLHVPVVRGGDEHRIDVFARENFAVVAGGEQILAPHLLAVLAPAGVQIGHRHQLDARHLHGRVSIVLAAPAGSDESKVNVVVGRVRHRRRQVHIGGHRMYA